MCSNATININVQDTVKLIKDFADILKFILDNISKINFLAM